MPEIKGKSRIIDYNESVSRQFLGPFGYSIFFTFFGVPNDATEKEFSSSYPLNDHQLLNFYLTFYLGFLKVA